MPSQPPVNPASQPPTRRERRELDRAQTPRVRTRVQSQKTPAWRSPFVLVSAAAVIVIVALIIVLQKPSTQGNGSLVTPPANQAAATLSDGEALGKADAPATLEIWSDFQCPFCGQFVKDYMARVTTDFVLTGLIRVVPHDIALLGATADNESLGAAVGARCAGAQGKYWQYHDWLFYNQSGENKGAFASDRLALIADSVGVDRSKWDACIKDPAQAAAITRQTSESAAAGISSTPSLRVAGTITTGLPRTYADLSAIIKKGLPSASPAASKAPASAAPSAAPSAAASPASSK